MTNATKPSEIERQIAVLAKGVMQGVESIKYSKMWNSYMYGRIAQALLEESRCEISDTAMQLLEAAEKNHVVSKKHVTIHNKTSQAEINELAANPSVLLDVTAIDPARLPKHVEAALHTDASTFYALQLTSSKDIIANGVIAFCLPLLQSSGDIFAKSATSFSAPQLRVSENIYATCTKEFHVPQLQTSALIFINSAKSFNAPQLQTSKCICADRAITFDAPELQVSGYIWADGAASFNAPKLRIAEWIHAGSAKTFNAPQQFLFRTSV